jgi:hypothetical protein
METALSCCSRAIALVEGLTDTSVGFPDKKTVILVEGYCSVVVCMSRTLSPFPGLGGFCASTRILDPRQHPLCLQALHH